MAPPFVSTHSPSDSSSNHTGALPIGRKNIQTSSPPPPPVESPPRTHHSLSFYPKSLIDPRPSIYHNGNTGARRCATVNAVLPRWCDTMEGRVTMPLLIVVVSSCSADIMAGSLPVTPRTEFKLKQSIYT